MKNKILKGVTTLSVLILTVSVSVIDSVSYVPTIISAICLAWIALFTAVNKEVVSKW